MFLFTVESNRLHSKEAMRSLSLRNLFPSNTKFEINGREENFILKGSATLKKKEVSYLLFWYCYIERMMLK
jgi:hypothetical protein